MQQMNSARSWQYFIPAVLWWLLSLFLFLLPGSEFKSFGWMSRFYVDKLVHFGLFAVLVYLIYRPWLKEKIAGYGLAAQWLIPLLAIVYGVAIEFIQKHFVPYRSFDTTDILFDALGAVFPLVLLYGRLKNLTRRSQGF